MPKSNSPNASHKYSVNFVIIDPTAEMHSESIYFMWFCNTLENLHMKFRVGDIIRIENANMQVFNGHPQLVAKEHSAAVTIFQRREVLNSGRPIYPIDTPDKFASEIEAEQEGGVNNESQVAAAQSRRPYSDPAWNTTVLGVADLANIKLTKKLKKDLPKPDPNRPPKMWVDEVAKLLDLHTWATRRFAHHCYSDPSYHSTLHALQSYLYRCINSLDYANLSPTAEALPQDANLFAANQNRLCSGKCDVVCLVMCIHPPASSVDGLARMTVWDGTTNGVYAPNPIFGGEIRRAMQAPSLYDVFHASVITRDAATAAAAAAPATTTTTALPVAGSAGASSNSSSSAPPPAQPPGTEEDTSLPPVFPLGAKLTELENCTQATPPRLHGCGVKITAADISTNQHIMRCKAGMWVRIRNVYGTAQPVFGATLRADSHVCQLSPSCL